jgi:Proto-chlorophyllide reductase 57 kD subunit
MEPAGEAGIQWTEEALQEVSEVPLFLRARRLAEERARREGSAEVTREIFLESRNDDKPYRQSR